MKHEDNQDIIFAAIGQIDDRYLEISEKRSGTWRILALAACLCIVFAAAIVVCRPFYKSTTGRETMANERPTTEIEELPESAWPIDLGEASYAYVSIDELVEISSCIVEVQVDDIALSKAYCPYEGGTFEGGTATFKEYTVEVLQNLYGKEAEKTSIIIRCLEEFATDNGGVYDLSHPRFDVIKPGDHAIVFLKQPVPGEGYEISGYGQGFYLIKGENVYRVEGGTAADFISKTELIQITQEALAKLN